MSQTPPPIYSHPAQPSSPYRQQYAAPPPKSGGGKGLLGCSVGCLVIAVLLLVGGYFLYTWVVGYVGAQLDKFTGKEAVVLVVEDPAPGEVEAVVSKMQGLRDQLASGGRLPEVSLTDREINLLLNHYPEFQDLGGKAKVTFSDGVVHSQVSLLFDDIKLPPNAFTDRLKGRYFNGDIKLSVNTVSGLPDVRLLEATVNGMKLPQEFVNELSRDNLMKEIDDPEIKKFFERAGEIKVEGNRLIIRPGAAAKTEP